MKKIENKKVFYYKKYTDDFIESKNQNYKIDDNYKWIHKNIFYNACSWIIWQIASFLGFIYYKLILKIKIENNEILKKYKKQGYFIYGNHTQPVGDAIMPRYVINKRFNTIAGEANLGIPVIRKVFTNVSCFDNSRKN